MNERVEFNDHVRPIYLDPKSHDKKPDPLVIIGWGVYQAYSENCALVAFYVPTYLDTFLVTYN